MLMNSTENFLTLEENKKKEAKEIKALLESIKPENKEIRNSLFNFISSNYTLNEIKDWLEENRREFLSDKDFSIEECLDFSRILDC